MDEAQEQQQQSVGLREVSDILRRTAKSKLLSKDQANGHRNPKGKA